jgi:hypothetical protein
VLWKDLRGPARQLGNAIGRAVDAAAAGDRAEYEDATDALVSLPAEQTGILLGAVLRALLEDQHPDGLDSDDIQAVLGRCYRGAAGWLPPDRVRATVLVAALASALGIHEPGINEPAIPAPAIPEHGTPEHGTPDLAPVPTAAEYARHAPLLVADLLAAGRRPLDRYLDAAFTELSRAQTMELP